MKPLRALFVLFALFSSIAVMAQGDVQGERALFGSSVDVAYVFYQEATSASISLTETELVRFTLTEVAPEVLVIQTTPPSALSYNVADLATDWQAQLLTGANQAVNPYEAEAEIRHQDGTFFVTIVGIAYDASTQVLDYTARINQYLPKLNGLAFDLAYATANIKYPTEWGRTQVSISGSALFWDGLQVAQETGLGAIRFGGDAECVQAFETLRDLSATLKTTQASYDALFASLESASPVASDELVALRQSISTLKSQINYTQQWIRANCR